MAEMAICCNLSLLDEDKLPKGTIILNDSTVTDEIIRQIIKNPETTQFRISGNYGDIKRLLRSVDKAIIDKYAARASPENSTAHGK